MSSVCKALAVSVAAAAVLAQPGALAAPPPPVAPLRVCADPNNLPFSNLNGRGFENKIAELVSRDLGRPLAYLWSPQRRGFIRTTLDAGRCDLVVGVPARYERLQSTRPYYRSSYAFVSRRDRHLRVETRRTAAVPRRHFEGSCAPGFQRRRALPSRKDLGL